MARHETSGQKLITNANLVEYFQSSIDDVISHQSIDVEPQTAHYLVQLLSFCSRSEIFYERTTDGYQLKPLALMYADAPQEASPDARYQAFRRLGDVSLFICGVFSDSLNRKVVDVDYYTALGESAYASVSDELSHSPLRALSAVFSELSSKFRDCADVLAEVSDQDQSNSSEDTLRLYDVWLRTGSQRALKQLRALGIHPLSAPGSRKQH
jgi:hypothetical protein